MSTLAFMTALSASVSSPSEPAQPASLPAVSASAARGLFESDWVLMQWAVRSHDSDGDGVLSGGEVAAAAADFRRIADGDGDGRVTPYEYGQARAFILARY